MREIKFRMFDKESGELFTQNQFAVAGNGLITFAFDELGMGSETNGFAGYEFVESKDLEEVVLMQYTGLKDKNGVEICEGDVVSYKTVTIDDYMEFSVVFDSAKARFAEQIKGSEFLSDGSFLRSTRKIEVIGTIYQNPELIK